VNSFVTALIDNSFATDGKSGGGEQQRQQQDGCFHDGSFRKLAGWLAS
jgi:hypothetical protein